MRIPCNPLKWHKQADINIINNLHVTHTHTHTQSYLCFRLFKIQFKFRPKVKMKCQLEKAHKILNIF